MPYVRCPGCAERIELQGERPGTRLHCPGCVGPILIRPSSILVDPTEVTPIARRTRLKTLKPSTTKITGKPRTTRIDRRKPPSKPRKETPGAANRCPNCDTELSLSHRELRRGSGFRCVECGYKIVMTSRPELEQSLSNVAFPTLAPQGTLLDMEVPKTARRRTTSLKRRKD